MKKHQFNFELVSVVSWKPFPVNDPRATKAILMHGDIGYKFCWLLPQSKSTSWTWIRWDTNWERIKWCRCRGRCQLHSDIISAYLWFSSQVWWNFLYFTNSFSVSFTRLYSSIAFNLVLINRTLFGSFVFVFLCFCFFFSLLQLILVVYAKVDTRQWRKAC